MKDKEIDQIIEELKRPIPDDPESITQRCFWIGLVCSFRSIKILEEFNIFFDFNNKENTKKIELLWFEISILSVATALGSLDERLKKEFPRKTEEDIKNIYSRCEIDVIYILSKVFKGKTSEEIFDIYASYTWFVKKLLPTKKKTLVTEKVDKVIRKSFKITEGINDKEHHFANRINQIFPNIEPDELAKFASTHISYYATLLFIDAFAVVAQDKIKEDIAKIVSFFKEWHNTSF